MRARPAARRGPPRRRRRSVLLGRTTLTTLTALVLAGCSGGLGASPATSAQPADTGQSAGAASGPRAAQFVLTADEGPGAGFVVQTFDDMLAQHGLTQSQVLDQMRNAGSDTALTRCVGTTPPLDEALGPYFANDPARKLVTSTAAIARPADLVSDVARMRAPGFADCLRPLLEREFLAGVATSTQVTVSVVETHTLALRPPPGAVARVTVNMVTDRTTTSTGDTVRMNVLVDAVLLARGAVESELLTTYTEAALDEPLVDALTARLVAKLPHVS